MKRTTITRQEARAFVDWLIENGWREMELQQSEEHRLRRDDRYVILYYRKDKDNLTVPAGPAQGMLTQFRIETVLGGVV